MSEDTLPLPEKNYGPGAVLRAKREEYEWSVEAVAEALHLSTHSVKAIEADRYEDLPGATYVIGYWRSYARLLGIDIEETIEVNKRNLNIVTAEASGLDINRAFGHKAKRNNKGGGLVLLIILAAFAYYAWQQQFFGLLDGVTDGQQADVPAPMGDTQPVETPDSNHESPEIKADQVLRPLKIEPPESSTPSAETNVVNVSELPAEKKNDDSQGPAEQAEPGLVLLSEEVNKPVALAPSKPSPQMGLVLIEDSTSTGAAPAETSNDLLESQTNSAGAESSKKAQQVTVAAAAVPAQSESVQTASGMQTVSLTLSKDSWLDIRDKTRKRLLYKTEKAGQTLEVTGQPPFYIYIGTPDGVTIQYRGKEVPFETHKTGMFARFKLDNEMLEAL